MGKPGRPKRTQVSVKGETYRRLKEEADKRGCQVTELVEKILEGELPCPSRLSSKRG